MFKKSSALLFEPKCSHCKGKLIKTNDETFYEIQLSKCFFKENYNRAFPSVNYVTKGNTTNVEGEYAYICGVCANQILNNLHVDTDKKEDDE